ALRRERSRPTVNTATRVSSIRPWHRCRTLMADSRWLEAGWSQTRAHAASEFVSRTDRSLITSAGLYRITSDARFAISPSDTQRSPRPLAYLEKCVYQGRPRQLRLRPSMESDAPRGDVQTQQTELLSRQPGACRAPHPDSARHQSAIGR